VNVAGGYVAWMINTMQKQVINAAASAMMLLLRNN
jgi:hypothetical protein